ncbi:undecaprenyl-phosphate glucose phosphotransferase [Paraburkholderia sabiae]|uniref:Undecaprenyl-phosphate glucose phosphotransferase n=1 Tax=Paraburkholderia sabiae TaxID=273251 RepID=A0ABU9QS44_9BURK|nr:undecaprenyl-phosphate glucose phosphotransferase [Paraburkholderia sabiae]WJZ79607.1 undecaprenyl-phosphate glucose phosphotransferase [Paraburkholderia sabiae]CAD6563097.1 UDP-glucose:undecaprenyl-phosphate glucose-1-phosphate transferase [Paraburkholderia sabiae]
MHSMQGLGARSLDSICVVAGALLASSIRFGEYLQGRPDGPHVTLALAIALVLFPAFGLYESWRGRPVWSLLRQVFVAWLAVQACGLVVMFSLHRADLISRLWFAYWTVMSCGALILVRVIVYSILGKMRLAGLNLRNVAIVGDGQHCREVVEKVDETPDTGFRVAAVFNVRASEEALELPSKTYNSFSEFVSHVRRDGVQEIWLALPLSEEATIQRVVDEFRYDLVNVRFIPDVQSVALFSGGVIDLIGSPAINLIASPVSARSLASKEVFDRLFAFAALVALLPVFIVIAVAVKLSSKGPVFFRQYRKGADGRVFRIYKFRTMRQHAEQTGVVTQATRRDPRITKIGSFLRRTSLDELPQFINVLGGEMSVVGPRPHAIEHDEIYRKVVNGYIHRYRIKPGITGWAQVNGFRGETDRVEKMERRVEHDLYYIRNWSFMLDVRIVVLTIFKGFIGRQAY